MGKERLFARCFSCLLRGVDSACALSLLVSTQNIGSPVAKSSPSCLHLGEGDSLSKQITSAPSKCMLFLSLLLFLVSCVSQESEMGKGENKRHLNVCKTKKRKSPSLHPGESECGGASSSTSEYRQSLEARTLRSAFNPLPHRDQQSHLFVSQNYPSQTPT